MKKIKKLKKTNVLFIVVDDLRPQLACYGDEQIYSPNIDSLARDGILFENAYCQQAICGPSRASVLTGCRPDTTGIYDIFTPVRERMPDVLTMPQHFKNNAYQTVSIGKVYHHFDDDLDSWTIPPIKGDGEWEGQGYFTDEAIEMMKKNSVIDGKNNKFSQGFINYLKTLGPAYEAADVPDNYYPDGKNTEICLEKLRELQEQPFFMAMGFDKPHLPFNAPQKYWDLYPEEEVKLADNPFEPDGVTPYSLSNYGELRNYYDMPDEGDVPEDLARNLIRGYNACVSYMDNLLGKILDELEKLKLRDNTLIILWGDHGWKLGEHNSWSKHTNFEIDTRAPMILTIPGMENRGIKTESLVEFIDIYPTLCDLTNLPIPEHLEGLSMTPLLKNSDKEFKEAAYSQFPRGEVMGYSIRTKDFRYTEWQDRKNSEVKARELYDHRKDSQENVNLANKVEYAEKIKDLSQLLNKGSSH